MMSMPDAKKLWFKKNVRVLHVHPRVKRAFDTLQLRLEDRAQSNAFTVNDAMQWMIDLANEALDDEEGKPHA